MRKRIIGQEGPAGSATSGDWLDLEALAQVEVTSEDANHPIEAALGTAAGSGWRAAGAGKQIIRLMFDQPQPIRRIKLVFDELDRARTQEFVLRWADSVTQPAREIVRQQFNFSPSGSTQQVEEYRVEINAARILELEITPAINGGDAHAALTKLQLA